jgi:hypothetical protein
VELAARVAFLVRREHDLPVDDERDTGIFAVMDSEHVHERLHNETAVPPGRRRDWKSRRRKDEKSRMQEAYRGLRDAVKSPGCIARRECRRIHGESASRASSKRRIDP